MKFISFKPKYLLFSLAILLVMNLTPLDSTALFGFLENSLNTATSHVQNPVEKANAIGKVNITRINAHIKKYVDQGLNNIKSFLEYRNEHIEKEFIFIEMFSPFCIISILFFIGFLCFFLQNRIVLVSKSPSGPIVISKYRIFRYIVLCSAINIFSFGVLRSFFVNNFITNKLLESLFIIMVLTISVRFFTKLFLGIDLFVHKKLNFKEELPRFKKGQILVLHTGYFIVFSLISLVGCVPYIITGLQLSILPFNVWGPVYAEVATVLMEGLIGFYALCITLFIISNRKADAPSSVNIYGFKLKLRTTYRFSILCAVITYLLYVGAILGFVNENVLDIFSSLTTIAICLLLHKNFGGNVSKYILAFVDSFFSEKFIQFFGKKNVQSYTQFVFNFLNVLFVGVLIFSFWNHKKVLDILSSLGVLILEKCVITGFIIFITYKIQVFLNFTIKHIIIQRTAIPVHMRDNSRLYALLLMVSYFTPFLWVPVLVMILFTFGVSGSFILSAFGIITLAVGFGAKDLIQDVIRGFFLIIDKTLDIGENVTIQDKTGTIEALTLRSVSWRSDDGVLHSIPYGKISLVSSNTNDFAYAVVEIGVSYNTDLVKAMKVMANVGQELMKNKEFSHAIISPIEILGVDKFVDSAIMIKARLKVLPLQQWKVKRALNLRIKQHFDQADIVMPFPQMDVRILNDKA